jgi:hypothetical protein
VPDGDTVVSGGRDNTEVLECVDGRLTLPGQSPVRASQRGRTVRRIREHHGCHRLRRLTDGALVKTITSPQSNGLADFAPSNDGTLLATAENGYGDNVKLFDVASGGLVRTTGHGRFRRRSPSRTTGRCRLGSATRTRSSSGARQRRRAAHPLRRGDRLGLDPQMSIAFSSDGTI